MWQRHTYKKSVKNLGGDGCYPVTLFVAVTWLWDLSSLSVSCQLPSLSLSTTGLEQQSGVEQIRYQCLSITLCNTSKGRYVDWGWIALLFTGRGMTWRTEAQVQRPHLLKYSSRRCVPIQCREKWPLLRTWEVKERNKEGTISFIFILFHLFAWFMSEEEELHPTRCCWFFHRGH